MKPSKHQLRKHANYENGRRDRKNNLPCKSANGAYINGWYNPEVPFYYITAAEYLEMREGKNV